MDISILNIVIRIWKSIFQFWNFYLNSENLFDLKINSSIQKALLSLNIEIFI
jgi:hypothetical protein